MGKLVRVGMVLKTQGLSVIQTESDGSGENAGAAVLEKAGASAGFKRCKGISRRDKGQGIIWAESFRVQQDGRLLFQADYTNKDNLITWLLSFREKVELLEPEDIREEIKVSIERMKKRYEGERRTEL